MNLNVKGRCHNLDRRRPGTWRPGPYGGIAGDTAPLYGNLPGEKSIPITRQLHTPIVIPHTLSQSHTAAQAPSRATAELQTLVRDALLTNTDPFQNGPPTPQKETANSDIVTPLVPQPPRQPSAAYGPDGRVSYLSSLSSGFGDLKIDIPESGPSKPANVARKPSFTDRISRNNFQSRFSYSSWTSTPTTPRRSRASSRGNRDTMTSIESTPRFRSVNSWVGQQAKRIKRQQEADLEIDNMPDLPTQTAAIPLQTNHQRQPSEDNESIFGFHPGDEVPIAQGKRVSSKILDKII